MKSFEGYLKKKLGEGYVHLTNGGHKPLSDFFTSSNFDPSSYLQLSGGNMTGSIGFKQAATSNYVVSNYWLKGGVSLATYNPQIGLHNTGGDGNGSICILPYATETSPWGGTVGLFIYKGRMLLDNKLVLTTDNSSVSKSGDTLTVNIGGTSYSLTNTNTWRDITNDYNPTTSSNSISLSLTGAKSLYNALLNGYASSAGNADTVDNLHASSFLQRKDIRSDQDNPDDLRYNYGGFDKCDYNGTYASYYPTCYGQYISLQNSNNNTAVLLFFDCPCCGKLSGPKPIYVRTRGAGETYEYSPWGALAYLTDNVASATKLLTARTLTIGNTGKTFNGTADVSWTLAEIGVQPDKYLWSELVSLPLDSTYGTSPVDWAISYAASHSRSFVYNTYGAEYSYLNGMNTNNNYGSILKMGYSDKYLRILRKAGGTWQSSDWEKVSAGYADSAGNADTLDGYHASAFLQSASGTFWGQSWSNGGTVNGNITMDYEYTIIGYMPRKKSGGGGWAYDIVACRDAANNRFMHLGVYGGENSLSYIYLGANDYYGSNLRIDASGNAYAANYYTTSDIRRKENIKSISNLLPIYEFNWKSDGSKSYGFIAQWLEETNPELVSGEDYKHVNYNATLALYLAKLSNVVEDDKAKIARLEARVKELERRIV